MKFVFAPDSFKGSLSALRATELLKTEALKCFPDAACICAPVADGGEGTVEAIRLARGGREETVRVHDPLDRMIEARYAWIDNGETAVLEMAQASGLPLMGNHPDPMNASSFGTGEMLLDAVRKGAKRIWMGIGGSATNDGGMGMLIALGAKVYDVEGNIMRGCGEDMIMVGKVDLSDIHIDIPIRVICDVRNPLLGKTGATAVYGPQKGMTPGLFPLLENGMRRWAALLSEAVGHDVADFPGAGAAGGLGAALGGVLGAKLCPGIDTVLDIMDFDALLEGCDLVITGEGRIDAQSVRFGKVPAGVAARCVKRGIPVVALVGGIGEGAELFYEMGGTGIFSIADGPITLEKSMKESERLYAEAAARVFRLWKAAKR